MRFTGLWLADAGGFDHMSGVAAGAMVFWMVLSIAALAFIFVMVERAVKASNRNPSSPATRLAERFADGEIDEEEFLRRRDVLDG